VPFVLIPGARTIIDPDKLVLIWTIASAVADVAITLSMMTILMNAKSRSTIKETRNGISQLLRVTIQTGFLTSTLAIPIGPLYLSGTEGYELTWFPLGKCYLISLLANLNARSHHPTVRSALARNNVPVRGTQMSFQDRGEVDATHGGMISFIRSTVRTIHRDLTTSQNDRTSRMDQEAKSVAGDGGAPEVAHACDGETEEAGRVFCHH